MHRAKALPAQSKGDPADIPWETDDKQDDSAIWMVQ